MMKELESWHRKNLSKYKWLRGGIEVVEEVCVCCFSSFSLHPLPVSRLKVILFFF